MSLDDSTIIQLLTEHNLEFVSLKGVYTCQNAKLLKIKCHGSFVSCSVHVFQKMTNNSSISNGTRCGGLNPSFHHCYKSEINSFESTLTSILIVEFCIVIFGVVGNSFLFFLMRRPRFTPHAFAVYFMFSAVSDSFNLIINLASDVAGSTENTDFSAMAAKQGTCGLFLMLTSVTGMSSPWLIVLLTLDRFISTCFPQKYSAFVNRRRGIIMASGLVLLAVVVNIPFATSYKTYIDFDEDTNSTSYSCELAMFLNHCWVNSCQLLSATLFHLVLFWFSA